MCRFIRPIFRYELDLGNLVKASRHLHHAVGRVEGFESSEVQQLTDQQVERAAHPSWTCLTSEDLQHCIIDFNQSGRKWLIQCSLPFPTSVQMCVTDKRLPPFILDENPNTSLKLSTLSGSVKKKKTPGGEEEEGRGTQRRLKRKKKRKQS